MPSLSCAGREDVSVMSNNIMTREEQYYQTLLWGLGMLSEVHSKTGSPHQTAGRLCVW